MVKTVSTKSTTKTEAHREANIETPLEAYTGVPIQAHG